MLPIGRFGPYPQRLRDQFEGVILRFRTGGQWREMPAEFGRWQTVYDAFARWRDAGVFAALIDAMISEAARRGQADVELVSVDSCPLEADQDFFGAGRCLGGSCWRVGSDASAPMSAATA